MPTSLCSWAEKEFIKQSTKIVFFFYDSSEDVVSENVTLLVLRIQ